MIMTANALLDAALAYAEAGMKVFPCWPGTKVPATTNGFHSASDDVQQIKTWWAENADYNIGMSPETCGWAVVDVEAEALTEWSLQDVPETYTVRSPRGGLHAYFEGSLPSRVKTLIPGAAIDTRGRGGYVLLPPSIVGGKNYAVECDLPLAPLPEWVSAAASRAAQIATSANVAEDTPSNLQRARTHVVDCVKRGRVAIEGFGGDAAAYNIAAELRELGISQLAATALLAEVWNPQCSPPWSASDLAIKVANAYKYAQNGEGAYAVASAAEVFAAAIPKPTRSRFYPEDEDEMEVEAPISWLIPDLLIAGTTAMLLGKTQSYKSYLALDMALSIASGIDYHGRPVVQGPVVYAGLEGMRSIRGSRRRNWKLGRGVTGKIENFFTVRAPLFALPEEVQEFGEQVAKRCAKPALIVIDTLAKSALGLNIMDHADASRIVKMCESLAEGLGCTVLVLHHIGKDDSKGAMGSAAFHAGFDTVMIARGDRVHRIVELTVEKHKDAPEPEDPLVFQARSVDGDIVFDATTTQRVQELHRADDPLDPSKVGATLRRIGAVGAENAVSTHVLAGELAPAQPLETASDRQSHLGKVVRKLRALAKTSLMPYATQGAATMWSLP